MKSWFSKSPLLSLLFAGVAAVVWGLGWLYSYSSSIDDSRLQYSTYLTDNQGDLLHVLLAEDERIRIRTTLDDVDGHYLKLLLAYEDQRYWQHNGVDWLAMGRAVWQLASTGRVISGGSTLTMQAVRLMEPKPRTIPNKLDQMRKAIALEKRISKEEILGIYLTLAPFGGNIEGVNAASLVWFNKWPGELTPAEAALLVALPQSPETRRPDRYPDRALNARNKVLSRAVSKSVIDSEYLHTAELSALPTIQRSLPRKASHLAWRKRFQDVEHEKTTIDAEFQNRLTELAKNHYVQSGLNMGILVGENTTGNVVAYIGSQDYFDFSNSGAVDYIQAIRSPGSTLKPFIYAFAQASGDIHFNTLIEDGATSIQGYQPLNLSKTFSGEVTIIEALQRSLNTPAVKVIHKYGTEKFKGKLASAGIELENGEGLPIALGGAGVSLYDLVSLYTSLGNEGRIMPLTTQLGLNQSGTDSLPETTIRQLNWILSNNSGQAGRLHGSHNVSAVAVKTGTGPGGSDALAIGNNGKYTVGIWVGSPDGSPVAGNTGLRTAVPIFNKVMDVLPKGQLLVSAIGNPPSGLASFGGRSTGFKVHYPINNSQLQVSRLPLRLKLDLVGVTYPIWVSINDLELVKIDNASQSIDINHKGSYRLEVVDSKHLSGQVDFYLK